MSNELFSVKGKVALVTGAGSGLGERFAKVLAENGASVVCVARRIENLERVAKEIEQAGGRAIAVAGDVLDRKSIIEAFEKAESTFGVVNVLVNCAGIQAMVDTLAMEDDQFTTVMDINVNGIWRTAQICSQRLVSANQAGSIINIASILGVQARPGSANYCASKAGAAMLTKCLDHEARATGIRAIGLSPGTVATQMQRDIKASGINPVSRLNWEDHIPADWPAKALLWMCGPEADAWLGDEISLRDNEIRSKIGLV